MDALKQDLDKKLRKKILRFNNNSFMIKVLRKAIMHRSRLKNLYHHKSRTNENSTSYKKQNNFV